MRKYYEWEIVKFYDNESNNSASQNFCHKIAIQDTNNTTILLQESIPKFGEKKPIESIDHWDLWFLTSN